MFLLAQISDLLYLFFLMFLSETIFRASKEILYGVISTFFILKIILLYFYINNRKYSILYFILLRFILFVFPAFYFIGLFLNIEFIIQSGIIYYILFLFTLIIDFICIYKSSPFKIWKIVLILLYFMYYILFNYDYFFIDRRSITMTYLKNLIFLIYLIFIGFLFTKYTSLHWVFLIPYSLLTLIEYVLFIKKDK